MKVIKSILEFTLCAILSAIVVIGVLGVIINVIKL